MRAGAITARIIGAWSKTRFASFAVLLSLICGSHAALAETSTHHGVSHHLYTSRHHGAYATRATHHHYYAYAGHHYYAYAGHQHFGSYHERIRLAHYYGYRHHYSGAHYAYSRLQCVPYAREVSHIQLSGDAFLWWAEASGRYARGSAPVEGAVLNFRSIRRMPLGHVAVVTAVLDSRTILVTQANWIRGTITNDVTMQDVSPNNDWSQVQVELGDSSRWGAAYPTYGFIYNQPPNSTVIASTAQGDEVAEAPKPQPIQTDAPDRNLQ
jgi:surface antigen